MTIRTRTGWRSMSPGEMSERMLRAYEEKLRCPRCGYRNPENQRGCNKCGEIYNPPLQDSIRSEA